MGIELYNNVKQAWWRWMVYERDDIEGLDSSIILNRLVWKYSGHEETFSDPLVDCKECNSRFRADKVWDEYRQRISDEVQRADPFSAANDEILNRAIGRFALDRDEAFRRGIPSCPNCGKTNWTDTRP